MFVQKHPRYLKRLAVVSHQVGWFRERSIGQRRERIQLLAALRFSRCLLEPAKGAQYVAVTRCAPGCNSGSVGLHGRLRARLRASPSRTSS